MKAKFDKIMANFVEENKKKNYQSNSQDETGNSSKAITNFKDKNL